MKKPSTNTALGPIVIVAVDQNENPPLIQDELAYKILPGRGKVIIITAKWRPLRQLLWARRQRRLLGPGRRAGHRVVRHVPQTRPLIPVDRGRHVIAGQDLPLTLKKSCG